MTIRESILSGICTRQFMRVEFTDSEGQLRTEVLEGYTFGYDNAGKEVLKGFHWASDPGPWYSTGNRTYPIERIIAVELTGYKFGYPQDENGAKDFSQFAHVIGSCYYPASIS
jgi:hypothetical protein